MGDLKLRASAGKEKAITLPKETTSATYRKMTSATLKGGDTATLKKDDSGRPKRGDTATLKKDDSGRPREDIAYQRETSAPF